MNYFKQFKEKYLVAFWRPTPAVIALGVLAAYYFGITGTYWAVTGEFTRWGGHILQLAGVDISDWGYYKIMNMNGNSLTRVDGVMIIGMFAGCIAAAFWGNNVKLRMPASKIRIAQALIGGIIAGFGARLGMGCNLASLFTGIPQFSAHAWFFTLAMIIGVYLGTKVTMLSFFQSKIKLEKVSCSKDLNKNSDESKQKVKSLFTIGSFVFVAMIIWALYLIFIVNSQKLGIAMLFGAAFGLLIAKAQICFTSAFRDIFTTGRSELAIAIVIGMAVSTIGVFSYIMIGTPAKWIVGIGNVIGATLLAFMWDGFSLSLATSWPKINLLESFGQYGGLFMNYIFLFLLFLLILKLEKNYRVKLQKKGN